MLTRTTAIRVLFLFTAFLAYAQPSAAAPADFHMECDSHCEGGYQIMDCGFADFGYGDGWDAGSICSPVECFTIGCSWDTSRADLWAEAACDDLAGAYHSTKSFHMTGCLGYDGTAEGSFYCSFYDPADCT